MAKFGRGCPNAENRKENVRVYAVPYKFYFERDFQAVESKYPLVREFKFSPPALDISGVKSKLLQI